MANHLNSLLEWFPTGTAEGEELILEQVFVYLDEFSKTINPPKHSPFLLVGSKGSGKSALVKFSQITASKQETIGIVLTPSDISLEKIEEQQPVGEMVRVFYDILIAAIANKLSEPSLSRLSEHGQLIYSKAVSEGIRSPDKFDQIVNFISEAVKPITLVDVSKSFEGLGRSTQEELTRAINKNVDEEGFYLFFDDTDQVANISTPGHLNRIWSLILAIRKLSNSIYGLRAVVTLRSEVWERLKTDQSSQRDQVDHFKSLIVNIKSDQAHINKIISRRLELASQNIPNIYNYYYPFFEGEIARAPYSDDFRSWEDLILVRSRDRPRDAIQLINHLARSALEKRKEKIDEEVFQHVVPIFSRNVSDNFVTEYEDECSNIREIIRSFSSINSQFGGFSYKAEDIIKHLRSIPSRFATQLRGTTIQQNNEIQLFDLWRFLYMSGFLNARVSDSRETAGYRHIRPLDDSTLVSKPRWNDMQTHIWEVHPVFRDYLIETQRAQAYQAGLPMKRKRKTKKNR